ncbi:hypothetical protein FJ872_27640 [Mesorhizobium sp. B2-5-9]|uniref:hypothetical protein n=1 Tax=unclassified Mesorhizobium TaxID=325217 RepID=UPI00112A6B7C|nr:MULTISPECIES: hypothetical protein [unclassified Mesorhizobium]MBZ9907888.1 hypothetical protein [Mesorhizobium sp. BR115XR7A]MBZ9929840.1 hypothetical protein [Mesorhizobium sp. BR1-1-5]TPK03362.1 hypothetical protein FJ872_27640 [Mesorhizobium sp. B2-5-9]TPK85648.1 hypothetical protein FJ936_08895 [Mesorhizobium sp. B2-4-13]
MTSATEFEANSEAGEVPTRLRAAGTHAPQMVGRAARPFDVPAGTSKDPSLRDALVTGLLVIYPTVATVAAIVAGLFLASANGT